MAHSGPKKNRAKWWRHPFVTASVIALLFSSAMNVLQYIASTQCMDATNDFAAKEIQMAADRNRSTQEIEKLKSEISAIDHTASTKLDLADELAKVKTALYKKREKLQDYRDDRPFDYEQAFAPALKELRADIAALEKRRSELGRGQRFATCRFGTR